MANINDRLFGLSPFQLSSYPYRNTNASRNMASNNPEETLSDATEEVHSCANCGKDVDDQQPCYRCINAPDITGEPLPTTWFCSLHCQMENQRAHMAACRAADARRTLYRAGRTCELIFQCCHEVLSKITIARVEKNGKDIYVHQASELEMQSLPPLSTLFENDDDKSAAIACIASSAAIPFARGLLEHMLPGQYHPNPPQPSKFPFHA